MDKGPEQSQGKNNFQLKGVVGGIRLPLVGRVGGLQIPASGHCLSEEEATVLRDTKQEEYNRILGEGVAEVKIVEHNPDQKKW